MGTIPSWSASRGSVTGAPALVLCLDPGETTGWAIFSEGELISAGQVGTARVQDIVPVLNRYDWDAIVVERYSIYVHKVEQHVGSSVYTLQLIGAIEMWRTQNQPSAVPIMQSASQAKVFVTDAKLKAWEMYIPGKAHARDAIRHGCYFYIFGQWRRKLGRIK